MADCPNTATAIIGKGLAVEYATGCGDANFEGLTYLPLGSINSKQLTTEAVTADNTSDLSGAVTSNVVVRSGFTLTVSGFANKADNTKSAQNALIKYYWTEIMALRQPTVWIKISGPEYPFIWYVFMNYTGGDEGAETDAVMTRTFNFEVTDTGDDTNVSVNIQDA